MFIKEEVVKIFAKYGISEEDARQFLIHLSSSDMDWYFGNAEGFEKKFRQFLQYLISLGADLDDIKEMLNDGEYNSFYIFTCDLDNVKSINEFLKSIGVTNVLGVICYASNLYTYDVKKFAKALFDAYPVFIEFEELIEYVNEEPAALHELLYGNDGFGNVGTDFLDIDKLEKSVQILKNDNDSNPHEIERLERKIKKGYLKAAFTDVASVLNKSDSNVDEKEDSIKEICQFYLNSIMKY